MKPDIGREDRDVFVRLLAAALAAMGMAAASDAARADCPSADASTGETLYRSGADLYEATRMDVTAGGALDLGSCEDVPGAGYLSPAPALSLAFTRDTARDVRIRVEAACDATLLVNDVNRNWLFDDDTNATDPELWIEDAPSGRFDIWIGTIGPEPCAAEIEFETFDVGSRGAPSPDDAPTCPTVDLIGEELDLSGDALRTAKTLNLAAGGTIPLSGCSALEGLGYVRAQPDFSLNYTRTTPMDLRIRATSTCDTALLANDFYQEWHYSDDVNGQDPELVLANPETGRIDIWVATLPQEPCDATVTLSTEPARGGGGSGDSGGKAKAACLNADQPGEPLDFASEAFYSPMVFPASAGGSVNLEQCAEVSGIGFVNAQPTYSLNLTQSGAHDLRVRASGTCDLVLIANDFHRTWHYSDDVNGRDPEIVLLQPPTGRIDFWLGTIGTDACKAKIEVEAF